MTAVLDFTASQARDLTDRIKIAVDGTWELIKQAYVIRAWEALGYSSWDDYCTREFGTSRLRLPREERQEVVSSMREIGMSTRAIAAATGTSQRTVVKELAGESFDSPDEGDVIDAEIVDEQVMHPASPGAPSRPSPPPAPRVTGIDGKSYAAQPTRPQNRPALPPQFRSAAAELTRLTLRLGRLKSDGRYRSNRVSISDQCVPELRRAVEVLTDLLHDLTQEQ